MNRRQFLSVAAASAFLAQAQQSRQPNIVWIMADDMGYADLGCYGQKHIQTPKIDKLAKEGLRFTDAYSGCTVCAPSRSVLMTGKHMGHTSIRSNPGGVPLLKEDLTVATMLKRAGYTCGCFGKWGLGDINTDGVPSLHGFDTFYGFYHQVPAHFHYPGYLYSGTQIVSFLENLKNKKQIYANDMIAEQALAFIDHNAKKPFFLSVPFTVPHLNLAVPKEEIDKYHETTPEDRTYVDKNRHYADQPYPRAAYAGMITRLDSYVGKIMASLNEKGLDNDTIVFFTSDNGSATALWNDGNYFESTGGLRGHKQNMYEGGIRVPMIARWPGKIAAGTVNKMPWMFEDFFPTALDIAGAPPVTGLDGRSILPTLLGKKQQQAEFLYWELPTYSAKTGTFPDEKPMMAVRMGSWKAVRPKADAELELYNLAGDPYETTDMAKQMPEVMAKIEAYLKTARTPPRPQKNPINPLIAN